MKSDSRETKPISAPAKPNARVNLPGLKKAKEAMKKLGFNQ
jgi:hypothetical protein